MHVTTRGPDDGPTLVLLHGGIGTGSYHWGKQADHLSERFRVLMPDLPGHGHTTLDDPDEYSRDTLVDAVVELLEHFDDAVHVGGFSMGGHTALAIAEQRPELFASLMLVGVSIREHDGLRGWRTMFHPDQLAEHYPFWAKTLSRLHEPLGGEDAWRDVCLRDAKGLRVDVDVDRLADLDVPVLLLRGDRDSTVDLDQYRELRAAFDGSDEAVVPAGRHDVQLTRADIVATLLADFYERVLKR